MPGPRGPPGVAEALVRRAGLEVVPRRPSRSPRSRATCPRKARAQRPGAGRLVLVGQSNGRRIPGRRPPRGPRGRRTPPPAAAFPPPGRRARLRRRQGGRERLQGPRPGQDATGVAEPVQAGREPDRPLGVPAGTGAVGAARRSARNWPDNGQVTSPPRCRWRPPSCAPGRRTSWRAGPGPWALSPWFLQLFGGVLTKAHQHPEPRDVARSPARSPGSCPGATPRRNDVGMSGPRTASAPSRVHSPGKTDSRRKADRSRSGSRSWLQAIAVRRSRCRPGRRATRGEQGHPTLEAEGQLARACRRGAGPPPAPTRAAGRRARCRHRPAPARILA